VIVAFGDVAVNVYHTLYALPLPHVGAGAAAATLCKLPVTGEQVIEAFSVDDEVH
jgi:hypothetical protein